MIRHAPSASLLVFAVVGLAACSSGKAGDPAHYT
jgi:hypothetical protein